MKKSILFLFVLLSSFSGFAQSAGKSVGAGNVPVLQRIVYTALLQYENTGQLLQNWASALEPSVHQKFISAILNKVEAGTLPVFETNFPYTTPLSYQETMHRLVQTDTILVQMDLVNPDAKMVEKVTVDTLQPCSVKFIAFDEEWQFDQASGTFIKIVKGIGLTCDLMNNGQSKKLFYVPLNTSGTIELNEHTLLTDNIQAYNSGIAPSLSGDDSTETFRFLSLANRKAFPYYLLHAAQKGTLAAYSPDAPNEKKLSVKEVNDICLRKDTFYMSDRSTPQPDTFITKGMVREKDIRNMRFLESWYFDSDKMMMVKKVKGVILNRSMYDKEGHDIAEIPLFCISLNGSAKEVLTTNPIRVGHIEYVLGGMGATDSTGLKGLDTLAFRKFRTKTLNLVKSHAMNVYDANNFWGNGERISLDVRLSSPDVDHIFFRTDTIQVNSEPLDPNSSLVSKIRTSEIDLNSMKAMKFDEEWNFNPGDLKFTKKVRGLFPAMESDFLGHNGLKDMFYMPLNTQVATPAKTDEMFVLGQNISSLVKIDGMEKLSQDGQVICGTLYNNYMEMSQRESMFKTLLDGVMSGKIRAFVEDGSHKKLLKPEDLKAMLLNYAEDPEPGMFKAPLGYQDIDGIRFYETWYFDVTKNAFFKQVKGIALGVSLGDAADNNFAMLFYVPVNP